MNLSKFEKSEAKFEKMRKFFFILIFSVLFVVVVTDQIKSYALAKNEVQNDHSLSWVPSDLTVTFTKKFPQQFHGRALSTAKTIHNETLPAEKKKTKLQVSSNTTAIRKTRTNDSFQRYSGKLILHV
jgi:methionine-rich copper-binding protein CopC